MKIDRLLETTLLLLNKGSVTAGELARRFGVSTRTIYRDLDILSAAGVPVYANRGAGGGIALLDNYLLPKTIVSKEEGESILFSLQSLKATQYPETDRILEKLGALFRNASTDWIQLDFSPWGSNPNEQNKLSHIKTALLNRRVLKFEYVNTQNIRGERTIEPLRLIFKARDWYLWGFDKDKQDFRLFRLSRIKALSLENETFLPRKEPVASPPPSSPQGDSAPPANARAPVMVDLVLKFQAQALHRLYDDYSDHFIQRNADGTFTLKIQFPEDEWVYGYIMSFGPMVTVIEPPHVRELIKKRAQQVLDLYPEEKE